MGLRGVVFGTLLALLLSTATSVNATSVIPPTFEGLVDSATEIFVGTVVSRECRWVDTPWGRVIFTFVTFRIEESLKGGSRGQTTLRFRGGTVGDVTISVADMPEFQVGNRDLIFVGDRTAVSPLVGFMHGRFRIRHDAKSGVDRVDKHDGRPLRSTTELGASQAVTTATGTTELTVAEFRAQIQARLLASRRAR